MKEYMPDEKEKEDPQLYAANVRAYYSEYLGIPALDCVYKDKLYFKGKIDTCSECYEQHFGKARNPAIYRAE